MLVTMTLHVNLYQNSKNKIKLIKFQKITGLCTFTNISNTVFIGIAMSINEFFWFYVALENINKIIFLQNYNKNLKISFDIIFLFVNSYDLSHIKGYDHWPCP